MQEVTLLAEQERKVYNQPMNVTISYLPYYLVYSCRHTHSTCIVCHSFVKQRVYLLSNILEAMQMFSAAWRALKEELIANCFRKAGVVYAEDDITESEVLDDAETEENWKRLCKKLDVPTSVNLTDYVNVDCDVIVQK